MLYSTTPSPRRARLALALAVAAAMALFAPLSIPAATAASGNRHQTVDPNAPEMAETFVQGSGERIAYDVIDGMAIIEHDIILGTHAEVQRNGIEPLEVAPPPTCPVGQSCGVIYTSSRRAWPNAVVPYTLAEGTSSTAARNIQAAISHWEEKTSIRFVARTNEQDYVRFVSSGAGNICSSWLGRIGGPQDITYSGTGAGCLVHEIGHAVGMSHEQNRNDRDDHINIDFTNISGNAASQFRKATGSTDVGDYDFNSVMHYSAYSFALDRTRPVITSKTGIPAPRDIGGRGVLTVSDVQAVEFVYGNSPPPPPTTTTTTAPTTTTTTAPTTTTTATPTTTTTTTAPTTTTTEAPTTTEATTTTTEATTTTTEATTTTTEATTTTTEATTTTTEATTTTTEATTTTSQPTTTEPTTTEPTTTEPTTTEPTTTEPTTTEPTTTEPTTTEPTTTEPTTTTTTTVTPDPGGDRKPVIEFVSVKDGDTIPTHVPYGGINLVAYDPDAGSADGDGIRWVTLVLSDAETGRFLGARREYWSTYDWGLWLRSGRSYVLTAYAVSEASAGGGWSQSSITITAE